MAGSKTTPIPERSLRRLPVYLRLLKERPFSEEKWVSCTMLAEALGQDPTQVRKDLAFTGIKGRPKRGYIGAALTATIERFLGWDNMSEAFLAGVGNLGSALLGYQGFRERGVNIIAAFDADPGKTGVELCGCPVFPIEKLADLARRLHVRMGIIAVPAGAAQAAANAMVSGGIRGIWNFAPAQLDVPEGVIVENEDLSIGLAVLCRKLSKLSCS